MSAQPPPAPDRWQMIRDVAVFQLKLAVDGLRDLLLSPVSLLAALADLVLGREGAGGRFYEVVRFGRRTERWIDLFGAADRPGLSNARESEAGEAGIDTYVEQLQERLVERYERGGATATAKEKVDRAIDSIQSKVRREKPSSRNR